MKGEIINTREERDIMHLKDEGDNYVNSFPRSVKSFITIKNHLGEIKEMELTEDILDFLCKSPVKN